MRTIEVNLYQFNELDDDAKEKAREWYRRDLDVDYDCVIDDFVTIAEMIGINFDYQSVPLMGGGTRRKPKIWFSGFGSQGDGACFEGTYSYKPDASAKVREYAPQDETLHEISDHLATLQREYNGKLTVGITHRRGQYSHEHSVDLDVSVDDLDIDEEGNEVQIEVTSDDEEKVGDLLRDLMRYLYRRLEKEYEYQHSDEVVDEAIITNEYEFTEDGERS